jgi:hypothetical protein
MLFKGLDQNFFLARLRPTSTNGSPNVVPRHSLQHWIVEARDVVDKIPYWMSRTNGFRNTLVPTFTVANRQDYLGIWIV